MYRILDVCCYWHVSFPLLFQYLGILDKYCIVDPLVADSGSAYYSYVQYKPPFEKETAASHLIFVATSSVRKATIQTR